MSKLLRRSLLLIENEHTVKFGLDAEAANAPNVIGSLKRLLALSGADLDPSEIQSLNLKKTENGEIGYKVSTPRLPSNG